MFFISDAMAAEPAAQAQAGWVQWAMLGVFFVIFYFLLIRPQSKRAKEHKNMVEALQKGDEVVTSGGILGKISKISEQFITINIAQGVEINVQKHAVTATLPKGTIKSVKE